MAEKAKLPMGIENFKQIRTEGYYYVDKTGMIRELLENPAYVNLFTRPRRFGKTLNMSMLRYFFETGSDPALFDGLKIAQEEELCRRYMGKYPVIFLSLKGINASSYETACDMAALLIHAEARRMQELMESERLTAIDKEAFRVLLAEDLSEAVLCNSLKTMSELLEKHYGQKVIVLIDEYDVPLAKAYEHGYYDRMAILIRNLFEQVLKTNDSMEFAVLTGCLRISKESIFTGLNHLNVSSIADTEYEEYFGFTDDEVKGMLEYYGFMQKYQDIKNWYDGYQFGNAQVYCPWDVICYCKKLRSDESAEPQNFWLNTSDNEAVRRFIRKADNGTTRREIERLVAGEVIQKAVYEELTYQDMYRTADHLWSLLFTTGYLTKRGRADGRIFGLVIPNREIHDIFVTQILTCFQENVERNGEALNAFCDALKNGDEEGVEKRFNDYLRRTISIRDTFVRRSAKENFYHGILLGILGVRDEWGISSNRESGDGYSDIVAEIAAEEKGIIIEVKYAENGDLDAACAEALKQIGSKRYEEVFYEDGIRDVLKYGIACYKKRCRVMLLTGMAEK